MTNQKPKDQTLNGEVSKEKPADTPSPETKEENKMPTQEASTEQVAPVREAMPPAVPPPPPPPVPAAPSTPTVEPPAAEEKPGEVAKVTLMHIPGTPRPAPPPAAAPTVAPAEKTETPAPTKSEEPTVKPAEAAPETKADAPASPPAKRVTAQIDPAQAHVLVVEDNVPNFVLIARMLAYMGVQRCEWKTSGWQVVEFADTLPRIDLILMDIRLPYEDGFQALEKVRSSARLKDTLVVAVTAEASVDQMKRAQEAGFDGFLSKPLDPDRFPDQIRRVLSGEAVWEIH